MSAVGTDPAVTGSIAKPLGYVPALDGIRAMAVLAVMMFHFGQGWIRGGYIGVDVFFVLSGFLITTLLVQRLPEPFDVREFWARRARRLFPALALMLVVVFAYALTVPPLEQSTIRGQGIATIFYVNNWWLLHSGSEYFDAFQQPSPLLHTWTLSVEEQFYVLIPLLLLVLIALSRFTWRVLTAVISALLVASAGWTFIYDALGASSNRLYLGTDTRMQQLLLGSLMAVLGAQAVAAGKTRTAAVGRAAGPFGLVGLLGLLAMFVVWPEGQWIPAQMLLSAVLSGMLIIGVLTPSTAVRRWFSNGVLRRIGLISYGLYLWHWPIAVMIGNDDTNAATPIRLLLTFGIAILSYRYLEQPIRRGRVSLRWFVILPPLLVALAFACTPKASQVVAEATRLQAGAAPAYAGEGTTAYFVGDSVSGALWLPAHSKPSPGVAVTGSFMLGCPLFGLDFVVGGKVVGPPENVDCPDWERRWRQDVLDLMPQVGVLVGTSMWQFDVMDDSGEVQAFGSDGYRRRIERALDSATDSLVTDRIAITSVPCTALPSNDVNDLKNDRARTQYLNNLLSDYASRSGHEFIDLTDLTCASEVASLYSDGLHFTPDGALRVWEAMGPKLATGGAGVG